MLHALQPGAVLGVFALLVVLRDLGNGVVRVEGARFSEVPPLVPDCVALAVPFSAVVSDALSCALGALGVQREFSAGLARSMSDDCTELYVW